MFDQKSALFVSEDEEFVSDLEECIRDSYIGLIYAKSLAEMQQKTDNQHFDVMILDLDFPKIDIHKFMEQTRKIEDSKSQTNCPVLIVGSDTDAFFKRFYHFEKCAFMMKPFSIDIFREQMKKLLAKQSKDPRKGQVLAAGEVLLNEGDTSNEMYLVTAGKFKITKINNTGDEVIVGYAGAGELIGEMSFLENLPRSASVVALEQCVVHAIHSNKFYSTMENQPKWLKGLLKILSKRLRNANSVIAEQLPEGVFTDAI